MATTVATVIPEGLALSPDFMAELDLKPGSQVTVTLGDKLHDLFGVSSGPSATRQPAEMVIRRLQELFAGEPSLEDEYFRDRDKDTW